MASKRLGEKHDCDEATDPRINKELAKSLEGQNVVVTGAGRGVGRAIAHFLTYASAASLTLVALEQDEVEETARLACRINPKLRTKAVALDVNDGDAVTKLMREADDEFGGVDVLVCNAGRPPQWLPVADSDPVIWWDTVEVSLKHSFLFTRLALQGMRARKRGGRIIYTASSGAHTNRIIGSYVLGKLGQVRLAEIVHAENFKEHDIKCFAFAPGRVKTRFYTDFEDKVKGKDVPKSNYAGEDVPGQDESAQTAYTILYGAATANSGNGEKEEEVWDTPEMAAGLVTRLASGKMDYMSGRFVDASRDVADYDGTKDEIVAKDLHRVRLNAGDEFLPKLDY